MNKLQEQIALRRAVASLPKRPELPDSEEAMHSDVAAWRQYEAANPFEKARLRANNSAAIERGKTLDTYEDPDPDPNPPQAA